MLVRTYRGRVAAPVAGVVAPVALVAYAGLAALVALAALAAPGPARADPFIAPGRTELRADLQTLADAGIITAPVTAWPLNWQSIVGGIDDADPAVLSPAVQAALDRVRTELRLDAQTHRLLPHVRLGGTTEPPALFSFSATPRETGELEGGASYTGDRLSFNLRATRAIDSYDDWRPDGSYAGFAIRNWAVVGGYPERWWGPGIQGSLILSTNARPVPQIGVERISASAFEPGWLRWLGPWTVSSFIGELDDPRVVEDAKLFGFRMTARPLPQLEVAFSRTAQLCGAGRPCGIEQLTNMLLGRDNRGVNVDAADEPGNQLAGLDGRWSFTGRPFAFYWQWIGEDSRRGGPQIGSWLRLVGAELTGPVAATAWRHRTWFELADTTCQEGGGGFGDTKYNCAYEHSTYQTGYRYEGRPLGHTTDTDSESLAVVSLFSGPGSSAWELGLSTVRINQAPTPNPRHSVSAAPARRHGVEVAHIRDLALGRLRLRLSLTELNNELTGLSERDANLALEWLVGYW